MEKVEIVSRAATEVRAIGAAEVEYAGPDPNEKDRVLVSVKAKSGLVLLAGNFCESAVRKGDRLSAGQTLGKTSPSGLNIWVTLGVRVPGLARPVPLSSVPRDLLR